MITDEKKNILIASASSRAIRHALGHGKNKFDWAYLGLDSLKAQRLEKGLLMAGQRISIGLLLQSSAESMRSQFLDFIGSLSLNHHSRSWWECSLSEKNSYVSNIFLEICYLEVFKTVVQAASSKVPLLMIIESPFVREVLGNSKYRNVHIFESPIEQVKRSFMGIAEYLMRRLWFFSSYLLRSYIARVFFPFEALQKKVKGPLTLITTWVDSRSFAPDGSYQSINFGILGDKLRKQGQEVCILPKLLPGFPFLKAAKLFRKSGEPAFFLESLLSPVNILRAFWRAEREHFSLAEAVSFRGWDVSPIIKADLRHDRIRGRAAFSWLFHYSLQQLRKRNVEIASLIYPYENHAWEKGYLLSLKELFPRALSIGYQHATLSKMHLNYFFSLQELGILPLPDRIVTNGDYFLNLFLENGYHPRQLVRGGAIRYNYLFSAETPASNAHEKYILVAIAQNPDLALEIVSLVLEAFRDFPQYRVVFRFHPGARLSQTIRKIQRNALPAHFSVSNSKSFEELLQGAGILLYQDSAAALEGAALGIPVIQVSSNHLINMDPLDHVPKIRHQVSTSLELQSKVKMFFLERSWQDKDLRDRGMKVLVSMFHHPDTAYSCFSLPQKYAVQGLNKES